MTNAARMIARVKEQPDLFRLIHEFNRAPQNWVRPDYLEKVPHLGVVKFLSQRTAGRDAARGWVEGQLNLAENMVCWDFEEARRRVALLSWESLERVANCVGAVLKGSEIATLIDRNVILELKTGIGPDAYDFALRGGGHRKLSDSLSKWISRWQGGKSSSGNGSQPVHMADQVSLVGWGVLRSALAGESEALWQRFHLKVPPAFRDLPLETGKVEDVRQECWNLVWTVCRKLLSEEELKCFN